MSSDQPPCVLCQVLARSRDTPFSELFPGEHSSRQVVTRVDAFAILVDVAPIARGHALVVPLRHVPTAAELSVDEAIAMRRIITQLAAGLRRRLESDVAIFEHGRIGGSATRRIDGSCSIDHAHIHVAETRPELVREAAEHLILGPTWPAAMPGVGGAQEYYYLELFGSMAAIGDSPIGEPQILRKLLRMTPMHHHQPYRWHDQVLLADGCATRERVMANLDLLRSALGLSVAV